MPSSLVAHRENGVAAPSAGSFAWIRKQFFNYDDPTSDPLLPRVLPAKNPKYSSNKFVFSQALPLEYQRTHILKSPFSIEPNGKETVPSQEDIHSSDITSYPNTFANQARRSVIALNGTVVRETLTTALNRTVTVIKETLPTVLAQLVCLQKSWAAYMRPVPRYATSIPFDQNQSLVSTTLRQVGATLFPITGHRLALPSQEDIHSSNITSYPNTFTNQARRSVIALNGTVVREKLSTVLAQLVRLQKSWAAYMRPVPRYATSIPFDQNQSLVSTTFRQVGASLFPITGHRLPLPSQEDIHSSDITSYPNTFTDQARRSVIALNGTVVREKLSTVLAQLVRLQKNWAAYMRPMPRYDTSIRFDQNQSLVSANLRQVGASLFPITGHRLALPSQEDIHSSDITSYSNTFTNQARRSVIALNGTVVRENLTKALLPVARLLQMLQMTETPLPSHDDVNARAMVLVPNRVQTINFNPSAIPDWAVIRTVIPFNESTRSLPFLDRLQKAISLRDRLSTSAVVPSSRQIDLRDLSAGLAQAKTSWLFPFQFNVSNATNEADDVPVMPLPTITTTSTKTTRKLDRQIAFNRAKQMKEIAIAVAQVVLGPPLVTIGLIYGALSLGLE